ncbi:MAG: FkbM family methyltransferase, partial [Lachnospiraceae bacterium]
KESESLIFTGLKIPRDYLAYRGDIFFSERMRYKDRKYGEEYELERFKENIPQLKSILSDEKSKELVDIIFQKRALYDYSYEDICEPNQYFLKNILTIDPNAVFVDGGCFDGGTIDEFVAFQENKYDKVIAFEMDRKNYENIVKKGYTEKVKVYNYGLWNKKEEISYTAANTSSSLNQGGDCVAQCMPLDEVIKEKVTFIKMDIEGAEYNALLGAEQTIKKYKPQLAICVYHKASDIYELPFLLHKMVPEYRFYIRHHSRWPDETVLYATV